MATGGKLSNADMQAIINAKGAVIYRGTVYTTVDSLPSDQQIATDAGTFADAIGAGVTTIVPGGAQEVLDDSLSVNGTLQVDGKVTVHTH